ncbi:hypothetical protein MKFW12EY_40020 [Methylomonas koyamae]|nr:hypothetical protein MKFW12EY_40020 [Methylomonas koyamae]
MPGRGRIAAPDCAKQAKNLKKSKHYKIATNRLKPASEVVRQLIMTTPPFSVNVPSPLTEVCKPFNSA